MMAQEADSDKKEFIHKELEHIKNVIKAPFAKSMSNYDKEQIGKKVPHKNQVGKEA